MAILSPFDPRRQIPEDKTNNIAHIEVHDMLNYDGRWCSYGTGMESIVNNGDISWMRIPVQGMQLR
jgi:hypothetical protein